MNTTAVQMIAALLSALAFGFATDEPHVAFGVLFFCLFLMEMLGDE